MRRRFLTSLTIALCVASATLFAACAGQEEGKPQPKKPDVPKAEKGKEGPPAFVVGGFSVDVPPTTLMPGEETFPCFIAPLTITGPSHVVGGGSVTVGTGMHHGNITSRPKTGEGFRPCPADESSPIAGEALDVVKGGAVLFGSSTQVSGTEWRTFPDGMGFPLGDDNEVVLRLHYLNPTNAPITLAPHYEWYTIDEAQVTHLLGPFIWRISDFKIAPHSELTVSADCKLDAPELIVSMMPHMHKLGTGFTASFLGGALDKEPFLQSKGYDPDGVIVAYSPPVDTSQGIGFSFSCSWNNTLDKEIVEGVGDNEMCMLFGYAYPYESAYSVLASDGSCLPIAPPLPAGWENKPH
jgi:hypothetical protein